MLKALHLLRFIYMNSSISDEWWETSLDIAVRYKLIVTGRVPRQSGTSHVLVPMIDRSFTNNNQLRTFEHIWPWVAVCQTQFELLENN